MMVGQKAKMISDAFPAGSFGKAAVAGLLVAAVIPMPAQAAAPASSTAAAMDPAALAAARRLIAASDMEKQVRALMPQIIDAAMIQARSTFKESVLPDGLDAKLQVVMREHMASLMDIFSPDVQQKMAESYARHFSAADLNHLADLMADPAMVRFREQSPAVMKDLMPILMNAMAPKREAFHQEIMKVIADWIREHPQDKTRLAKPLNT